MLTDESAQKVKVEILMNEDVDPMNLLELTAFSQALMNVKTTRELYYLPNAALDFDKLSSQIKVQFYVPEKKTIIDFKPVVFDLNLGY